MTHDRIVSASRKVAAPAAAVFELIADPAEQPRWDGNDNLAQAIAARRITGVGDVFSMRLTSGAVRENHVVEFEEGRRIAWKPAESGSSPFGQLWRWEIVDGGDGTCEVTHTYDWTDLHDEKREVRARATTSDKLLASIQRLADLAETAAHSTD